MSFLYSFYNHFHNNSILDKRSLSLFRICISIYLLYDIYTRLSYGIYDLAWYTSSNNNDITRTSYLKSNDTPHKAALHRIWFYRGTIQNQIILFTITILLILFNLFCSIHDNDNDNDDDDEVKHNDNEDIILNNNNVYNGNDTATTKASKTASKIITKSYHNYNYTNYNNIIEGFIKFILFLLITSYQNRNMLLHDGSDSFIRHLLFWSCFLPLHEYYCIHIHLFCNTTTNTGRQNKKETKQNKRWITFIGMIRTNDNNYRHHSISCFGITFQIMLMYFGTVCHRTVDLYSFPYRESQWMYPQLSAVYYALSGSFAMKYNHYITQIIINNITISKIMTIQAMIIEGIIPILLSLYIIPYHYRHYGAIILFLLHFGLHITMVLPNWQYIGMITQIIWIPNHIWDNIILSKWTSSSSSTTNIATATTNTKPPKVTHSSSSSIASSSCYANNNNNNNKNNTNIISKLIQYFFICYMIYNWLGERNIINMIDHGDIGEGIRLMQHWVMFNTVDTVAHNTYYYGLIDQHNNNNNNNNNTNNKIVIDIFDYIKTNKHGINIQEQQYHNQQPWYYPNVLTSIINVNNISQHFPSPRWERAITTIISKLPYEIQRQRIIYISQTLCYMINNDLRLLSISMKQQSHDHNYYSLREIEMRIQHLNILPPGNKQRYDLKYRKYPDSVYTIPCIPPTPSSYRNNNTTIKTNDIRNSNDDNNDEL